MLLVRVRLVSIIDQFVLSLTSCIIDHEKVSMLLVAEVQGHYTYLVGDIVFFSAVRYPESFFFTMNVNITRK